MATSEKEEVTEQAQRFGLDSWYVPTKDEVQSDIVPLPDGDYVCFSDYVNERSALLDRIQSLEKALQPLVTYLGRMMENGPECDCPAEGHLCGWPSLNLAINRARAALNPDAKGE